MAERLTDKIVKGLAAPKTGNRITYDHVVKGFGIRITSGDARAFVLNYRTRAGRPRRYTIGSWPDWKTAPARAEAGELKKRIDRGEDPLAESEAERAAKTVADLVERFEEEHLPSTRPSTAKHYRALIARYIEPELKHRKVVDVKFSDIDSLHRKVSKRSKYQANRMRAVLSKMFTLAIVWEWRANNPVKGVKRNQEVSRKRYLSPKDELPRLIEALAAHEDRQAANILRLLLLTGARRGEVQAARWDGFDLTGGTWTKPGATTKQKTEHRVPISGPARQLLVDLRAEAESTAKKQKRELSPFVFPSHGETGHRVELKKNWGELRKAAQLGDARIHDLRHTFASTLAGAGFSLPLIGALLGHTQAQTTARYSHLMDDPMRAATERVGAIVSGAPSAEIVPMKGAR